MTAELVDLQHKPRKMSTPLPEIPLLLEPKEEELPRFMSEIVSNDTEIINRD